MYKAFVYRLYPTKVQVVKLTGLLNIAREIYNAALQERKEACKQNVRLNYYDQAAEIKELRKAIPEVAQLNFSATQNILRRLDKSFTAFFARVKRGEQAGYPRYKGSNQFSSIIFPAYNDGVHIEHNRLHIQSVGLVKIKLHRNLDGNIGDITIKRICDKWYAIFCNTVNINPLPFSAKQVGIDVGIRSFAVTSDRQFIHNPRYRQMEQTRIRIAECKSLRKRAGSYNRRKAAALLARQHLKIKNRRDNFHHQLARKIVNTYGFIAVENLPIKDMVRTHFFSKPIMDVGWRTFIDILAYKAEEAGRQFVKVDPDGTSQICSRCGINVPKTLNTRIHHCPNCGISLHRDLNAALNIASLGRRLWDITCDSSQSVSQEAVAIS